MGRIKVTDLAAWISLVTGLTESDDFLPMDGFIFCMNLLTTCPSSICAILVAACWSIWVVETGVWLDIMGCCKELVRSVVERTGFAFMVEVWSREGVRGC